mgnify:CR=1 FL=1
MKFSIYAGDIFQSDSSVIFKHSDMHGRIAGTLTFCMVMYVCDAEVRICDFFLMVIVEFILIACDGDVRGI